MIISHKNKFIFFKPIKVAGSSVEVALIPECGQEDIITGSDYLNEINSELYDYSSRNCTEVITLHGQDAKRYLILKKRSGVLTDPPITDDIIRESNEITWHRRFFDSHASPVAFESMSDRFPGCESYYRFTIIRNPWDVLVSYFWWCFSSYELVSPLTGTTVVETLSDFERTRWMKPSYNDSKKTLMTKFSSFLKLKEETVDQQGFPKSVQILDHLARVAMEFYQDGYMDSVLRFENLQSDFNNVCDQLSIKRATLPRLKSSVRKSPMRYSDYYTDESRKSIDIAFGQIIEKFKYSFKDPT